jgi:aspartate dehydrogenase
MTADLRVAIGGLGAIGLNVARVLDQGIDGLTLVAVAARNRQAAAQKLAGFKRPVPVLTLAELARHADIVVECVPAAAYAEIADAAIDAGRILMTLSCGQLLQRPDLIEKAKHSGARIIVPTGALIGLDAVRAAAESTISSVRIITRKPPKSLAGAPYLQQHDIRLDNLSEALQVFKGSARDGARGFPANVNVAAALSLAGIGADATTLEIWADPQVERNTHHIQVEADSARFEMKIENVPSEDKPATGKITALSTLAALRGLTSTLKVGT